MYLTSSTIWVLVAAAMVSSMQEGFATIERAMTWNRNTGNLIMRDLPGAAIGAKPLWRFGSEVMAAGDRMLTGGLDFPGQGKYLDILPDGG